MFYMGENFGSSEGRRCFDSAWEQSAKENVWMWAREEVKEGLRKLQY
jgi:hypothetical protein